MDREYGSEVIYRLIRENLHANSVIPIRSWKNKVIGNTYRQEMAQQFNDIIIQDDNSWKINSPF
jgi:hypothetical protein